MSLRAKTIRSNKRCLSEPGIIKYEFPNKRNHLKNKFLLLLLFYSSTVVIPHTELKTGPWVTKFTHKPVPEHNSIMNLNFFLVLQ